MDNMDWAVDRSRYTNDDFYVRQFRSNLPGNSQIHKIFEKNTFSKQIYK